MSTRTEVRNPDPACNPYLAFAAMLAAGLDGIENNLPTPEQSTADLYEMNEEERLAAGIAILPVDLHEALECLKASQVMKRPWGRTFSISIWKARSGMGRVPHCGHRLGDQSYLCKY